MRTLIMSEFVSLNGVIQVPGENDEDRDGGLEHGGRTTWSTSCTCCSTH